MFEVKFFERVDAEWLAAQVLLVGRPCLRQRLHEESHVQVTMM